MNTPEDTKPRKRAHEHAESLRNFLDHIQSSARVESVMTPWTMVDFVEAESVDKAVKFRAKDLMDRNHYSGVPLLWIGEYRGMFVRNNPSGTPRFERPKADHFVERTLGLIELIRQLRDTQRVVVGVGTPLRPSGWLTYADLSKRPFRVLLFALVAEVEYLLAEVIDRVFPDDDWPKVLLADDGFSRESVGELLVRRVEAAHWDVVMPLTTFAEIGHLAGVVGASRQVQAFLGVNETVKNQLKSLSELRNRVAHVVRPIVAGPSQISGVANQIDLMLGWIDTWSDRLITARAQDGDQ
jgi:hypothetical protein